MADVLTETDTYDVHIDPPESLDVEVDGSVSITAWGCILGNIENQKDLVDYVESQTLQDIQPIPIDYIKSLN